MATVSTCPSCNAATQPEARFCHACGAVLASGVKPGKSRKVLVLGSVATGATILAIASVFFIGRDEGDAPTSTPAPFPTAVVGSGQPIDLSTMTPRQAADRLFNRIMTASEQGNQAEAMRFVPMAVQAYAMVGALDADARYHLGLIHMTAGNPDKAREQIRMIRQRTPNHLLGFVLEYTVARQSHDKASAAQAYAGFTAAYATEIKASRQEYADHRNMIEGLRSSGGVSPLSPPFVRSGSKPGRSAF